ncbi:MAG: hypothetical protein U0T82_16635 [Bacteroidales bacterium]
MLLFAGYTTIFRIMLSRSLDLGQFSLVWWIAVAFAVITFATGFLTGYASRKELQFFDIGFRSNLYSFIIWSLISELWFRFGSPSKYESITVLHYTILIWGLLLLAHFIIFLFLRRKSIRGLNKDHIFD